MLIVPISRCKPESGEFAHSCARVAFQRPVGQSDLEALGPDQGRSGYMDEQKSMGTQDGSKRATIEAIISDVERPAPLVETCQPRPTIGMRCVAISTQSWVCRLNSVGWPPPRRKRRGPDPRSQVCRWWWLPAHCSLFAAPGSR